MAFGHVFDCLLLSGAQRKTCQEDFSFSSQAWFFAWSRHVCNCSWALRISRTKSAHSSLTVSHEQDILHLYLYNNFHLLEKKKLHKRKRPQVSQCMVGQSRIMLLNFDLPTCMELSKLLIISRRTLAWLGLAWIAPMWDAIPQLTSSAKLDPFPNPIPH